MIRAMIRAITAAAITTAALAATAALIHLWLNIPEVQYSYATKQCVQVQPATAGSCTNLPQKYTTTWVK